jgi:spore cortex biosynthesis protein YabQ
MMNEDIMAELYFLLHSFGLGVLIMILYDVLRIFRKLVPHSVFALALEDLVYWLVCGICIFVMLYRENNGSIRWFAVAGVACGMLLYNGTISTYITDGISKVLKFILQIFGKVFNVLLWPLKKVFGVVKKLEKNAENKGKKVMGFHKKRLKKVLKTVKIVISRH